MTALLIAAMGALGSLARWGLSSIVQRSVGERFPLGTLAINVIGSALIGAVMTAFTLRGAEASSPTRLALTAGLLGGFTTYSSFAFETWELLERRLFMRAT